MEVLNILTTNNLDNLVTSFSLLVSYWWNFLIFSQETNFSKIPQKISKYPKQFSLSPKNFSKNPHKSPKNQILRFTPCQPQVY